MRNVETLSEQMCGDYRSAFGGERLVFVVGLHQAGSWVRRMVPILRLTTAPILIYSQPPAMH